MIPSSGAERVGDNKGRKSKRRANGEGTIYRRKDGRWEGAAYVLTSDGAYKRVRKYGKSRDEVHRKLVELLQRSSRGIPAAARPWRVGEYLDYWLENVARHTVRPTTFAKYEQTVRLYLKPGLGNKSLERLRVAVVQTFLNGQLKAGHSVPKVRVMRTVLSAALTRAMREELIGVNVARLTTLPAEDPRHVKPWSVDEARRFLEVARNEPLYLAFVLLLVYGLRRGEVCGLAWDDVDLDENILFIRRQVVRVGGQLLRQDVKTRAGRRGLPILPIVRDALIDHAGGQSAARRRAGRDWHESGLVLTTRTGRGIEPRNLGRSFERIIEANGLRSIRLHDLRHSVAQLLKRLRVHPRDAMQILGHSRIAVTMEVYTDGDAESSRDALGKVSNELFGKGS